MMSRTRYVMTFVAIVVAILAVCLSGCFRQDCAGVFTKRGVSGGPLHLAALHGYPLEADRLLQAGHCVDERGRRGRTPLHCAAMANHPQVIELLLRNGAELGAKDSDGATALYLAASEGSARALDVLLAAGADPDARAGNGDTPLMAAALAGRERCVELLLAGGAPIPIWGATEAHPSIFQLSPGTPVSYGRYSAAALRRTNGTRPE
jgi:ankyrin repeat protein